MNVNVEKGLSRFALENKLNIDRTFILTHAPPSLHCELTETQC